MSRSCPRGARPLWPGGGRGLPLRGRVGAAGRCRPLQPGGGCANRARVISWLCTGVLRPDVSQKCRLNGASAEGVVFLKGVGLFSCLRVVERRVRGERPHRACLCPADSLPVQRCLVFAVQMLSQQQEFNSDTAYLCLPLTPQHYSCLHYVGTRDGRAAEKGMERKTPRCALSLEIRDCVY